MIRSALACSTIAALAVACSSTPEARPIDPEPIASNVDVTPAPSASAPAIATGSPTVATPAPIACTQMACLDGVELDVHPKVPRPGHYEITVAAGDKKGSCKITFPYPPCGTPATECQGTLPIMAVESGCDLPKKSQTFPKLRLGEAPEKLTITATRDGKNRGEGLDPEILPRYAESRPNGPACPPVCKAGQVVATFREKGDPAN